MTARRVPWHDRPSVWLVLLILGLVSWTRLALLVAPVRAADGEDASVQGVSVPAGYLYDNVDGTFLTAVSSAASTTASATVANTQVSGRRTIYPMGRTSFTVWLEGANASASAVVRFTYWAGPPSARVYKGHQDVTLTVDSSAPASLNPDSQYDSPRTFVDTGASKSVDVAVVSLSNGPVDVGVGTQ